MGTNCVFLPSCSRCRSDCIGAQKAQEVLVEEEVVVEEEEVVVVVVGVVADVL